MKNCPIFLFSFLLCVLKNESQIISTFSGNGTAGFSGDGGPAINAQIQSEPGLAVDRANNVYLCTDDFRIRKITPGGIISTIAGAGAGFSGDGGLAINAFMSPRGGIAIDTSDNIYFSDYFNQRIRKIDTSGIITTIAGTGVIGNSGDGAPATNAQLSYPISITVDLAGNVYVSNSSGSRIRKIDAVTGIISTVAGYGATGYAGDGGSAINAKFSEQIAGMATDRFGNLYVCDYLNYCVRKIDQAGIITTFAGSFAQGFSGDGGPANNAKLTSAWGIATDFCGNVYLTDDDRIRKINTSGIISTIAGNGTIGFSGDGGPALNAQFYRPDALILDALGSMYIGDMLNFRVRKVTNAGSPFNAPASIGSISGNTIVCSGSSSMFNTTSIAGATSYSWTLSGGLTGSSSTNSITLHAGTAPGTIHVAAANSCGSSLTSSLVINVSKCTGEKEIDQTPSLALYPNPNKGIFYIDNPFGREPLTISIISLFEEEIFRSVIQPVGKTEIDISSKNGLHFVRIYDLNHVLILNKKILVN